MTDQYNYKLDADEDELAGHIAKIVASEINDCSVLAGINTLNNADLLAGRPFRSGQVFVDAAFWAVGLQSDDAYAATKLPRSVIQAARELSARPDRMKILALRRAARRMRSEWKSSYRKQLQDIVDRCTIYLAALDDSEAKRERTALAFRTFLPTYGGPVNMEILIEGICGATELDYDRVVDKVLPMLSQHARVKQMARTVDLHAWLEGYKAAKAKLERPASDAAVIEHFLDEDELPEPEGSPAIAVKRPARRIVIPKMVKRPRSDSPAYAFYDIAGKPLPLVRFEGDLGAIARILCARWPWAATSIETILMDLVGTDWIRLRPTLLLGPPGTGKSSLAMALGRALGLEPTLYSAAGNSDGSFAGTNAQWSTARGSVSLQAVLRAMAANPCVVIDEIEKSGTSRHNGNLQDALVPMLEPATSRSILDTGIELPVDISQVSYLATANGLDGITSPLLDRLRVLTIPAPGAEHLSVVAKQIVADLRRERNSDATWLPDLDREELDLVREHWAGGSMRAVRRMIETIVAGREAFAARH